MVKIEINAITGGELPINVYACDVYLNNCALVGVISTSVPPSVTFILPPLFNTASAIGILLRDANNCEKFEIAVCGDSGYSYIFQNADDNYVYQFMDFVIYQFQGDN
jgi:hypothetical protein